VEGKEIQGNVHVNEEVTVMKKNQCSPGVYLIIGERGFRVGQSACMETRIPQVEKEHESCIGKTKRVLQIPLSDRKERLALEKELISSLDPKCNILGKKSR